MDEELAMSSLAYLMRDYKEQDEVILNDDDIEAIKYLQKRNKRLQNNWNELKKWLEDGFYWGYYEEEMSSGWVVKIMKEKMQELENRKV